MSVSENRYHLNPGQTNATSNIVEFNFVVWCRTAWPNECNVLCEADRIVGIRDLRRIMIRNFKPIYLLPLPEKGLAARAQMQQVRGQTSATLLFTRENKRNVERCCID